MITLLESEPPLPPKVGGVALEIRNAIAKLGPNMALLVTTEYEWKAAFHAAKLLGAKITTRKVPQVGWKVWRVDGAANGNGADIA